MSEGSDEPKAPTKKKQGVYCKEEKAVPHNSLSSYTCQRRLVAQWITAFSHEIHSAGISLWRNITYRGRTELSRVTPYTRLPHLQRLVNFAQ